MKANSIKIQYPEDPYKMEVVLSMNKSLETVQKIAKLKEVTEKGKLLTVDIKQHRKRRSLDANAYCWILCQRIAEVIGNTKEFVYKRAIRDKGPFQIVPMKDEAVEKWIEIWESRGTGWQSKILGSCKMEGFTNVINYYGSSVYDTKQMSLLLEEIIQEAKGLGIDTITDTEKRELLALWEGK